MRWVKRGKTTDRLAGLIEHDETWLEVPRPLPKVRLLSQTLLSDDPAVDLPGSRGNGDFNYDGVADGFDFVTWASY